MAQVEITHPKATAAEALAAIASAFEFVFERRPTQDELVILAAQSAHETRNWQSMPNYNPGGLKATTREPFFCANTTEYIPDGKGGRKRIVMSQRFKSFANLEGGCIAWLLILKHGYPQALAGAAAGDVAAFVLGLLEGWSKGYDYFTSPRDLYEFAVARHAAELAQEPVDWSALCAPASYGDSLLARVLAKAAE